MATLIHRRLSLGSSIARPWFCPRKSAASFSSTDAETSLNKLQQPAGRCNSSRHDKVSGKRPSYQLERRPSELIKEKKSIAWMAAHQKMAKCQTLISLIVWYYILIPVWFLHSLLVDVCQRIRWGEKKERDEVAIRRTGVEGEAYRSVLWIYSAGWGGVMDCKRRMGNKVMSMRAEDKLIWSQSVTLKTGLPSITVIKGLLHSNTTRLHLISTLHLAGR